MLPNSMFSFYWHFLFVFFPEGQHRSHRKVSIINHQSSSFLHKKQKNVVSRAYSEGGIFFSNIQITDSFLVGRHRSVFIFAMTDALVFLLFQCRRLYSIQLRRVSFLQTRKTWADAHCTQSQDAVSRLYEQPWLAGNSANKKIFRCPRSVGPVRKIVKHCEYVQNIQFNLMLVIWFYKDKPSFCDHAAGEISGVPQVGCKWVYSSEVYNTKEMNQPSNLFCKLRSGAPILCHPVPPTPGCCAVLQRDGATAAVAASPPPTPGMSEGLPHVTTGWGASISGFISKSKHYALHGPQKHLAGLLLFQLNRYICT